MMREKHAPWERMTSVTYVLMHVEREYCEGTESTDVRGASAHMARIWAVGAEWDLFGVTDSLKDLARSCQQKARGFSF
jgi:hypothetical protein